MDLKSNATKNYFQQKRIWNYFWRNFSTL